MLTISSAGSTSQLSECIGKASEVIYMSMAKETVQLPPRELPDDVARKSRTRAFVVRPRSRLNVSDIMSRDIASVCPGSSVVSAAKIMSSKTISCLIILDNGAPLGIVTETDILKKGVTNGNNLCKMRVEQIMSSPVRSVPPDLSVMDASRIMEAEHIRRLVILDGDLSIGIVTQTDMVRALASYTLSKEVSDVMTSDVAVVAASATVKEAAQLMASEDISCVVAMDHNSVVGIFTERDFLKRVVALKRSPARTRLKRVVSSPVVTVCSDCSVLSAWKLLERTAIRRLVVMDDERLVGMITQTDILKAIRAGLHEEEEGYLRRMKRDSDGILVIDDKGRVSNMNRRFAEIWDIPEELTREQDGAKLVKYIVSRLEETPPFFARVQTSCLTHEEGCHTLHLKNGKVLNVYSLRLARDEASAGRIWSFRDITSSRT
jgi:CBS domain-containing protein